MMRSKTTEKSVSKILSKIKAKHYDAARNDVINVLRVYRGLSPNLDTFVFDNGDERRLANISGTIPVIYKEKTYNIPICVWLKIDHPSSCPMAFITPTNDMQIKVSHHVDQTGRIYMQCLDEWRYPDSTLTGLINICREIFGELPPVFAKTKTTSSHNSESVINTHNGNVVTLPTDSSNDRRHSTSSSMMVAAADHDPSDIDPDKYNEQPIDHSNNNDHETVRCEPNLNDDITEEELRITLLSSVEEKIRVSLEEEVSKTQAEIQCLHDTNRELLDRQEDICQISKDLDQNIDDLSEYSNELHGCEENIKQHMTNIEKNIKPLSKLDVDANDIVGVQNTVHQQILNCQVEDLAIDDAIYILGDALRRDIISTEVYLKRVRNYSRKQFYTRALIDKCREIAGLDVHENDCPSSEKQENSKNTKVPS